MSGAGTLDLLPWLGWGSLLFWVLLATFTAVNLATFRRPRRVTATEVAGDVADGRGLPRVSIVIPARDEERSLGATLEAALASDWPDLRVVVVDDESSDATPQIAARAAADPRLTVVTGEPPPAGWLGKPHALAQGAAAAEDDNVDWLLFMDADVRLAPEAVASTIAHAERRGLDHLALFPRFERRGFWEELLMPLLAQALWMYFPSFLSRWGRLSELAFGSGSFNLVRASAYRAVGGHSRLAASVIDDIRLAVELKKAGYLSALELGDRLASIRMYHGLAEIVRGYEKNAHAIVAHRPLLWLLNLTLGTVLNLAPFAWPFWALADPAVALTGGGAALGTALAVALATRTALHLRLGYLLWVVPLHPLSALASIWISLRSLRAAYGRGVVRWRGREYRRRETEF